MARYLKQRGKRWWFQVAVPAELQARYGKPVVQENLRTSDRSLAERAALQRAAYWHREFDIERDLQTKTDPRSIYLDTVRQIEWIKQRYPDPDDQDAHLDLLFESVLRPELKRLGYVDPSEIEPGEISPEADAAVAAIKAAWRGEKEVPPEYQIPFSELAAAFIEDGQRDLNNKLTNQTIAQREAVYRLFADHIDDAPLATVTRKTATSFFDKVKRLNRNWGRSPKTKQRSLDQLLALAAESKESRLSTRTINRYVADLSALWKNAENRDEVRGDNPFKGFWVEAKAARGANAPWPDEAIKAYFRMTPDESKTADPDPFFWLPKIALLSGMRIEEICSLEASEVREAEGVTYFDIPEGKTDSSVRVVPAHSGLTDFLAVAPKKGFLFPHLEPDGPDDKRSWRIRKKLGARFKKIDGASTFHAFRKNAIQTFERNRVPQTEAAQIVGHGKKGITYRLYSPDGLTIIQKKELIELLSIPEESRVDR